MQLCRGDVTLQPCSLQDKEGGVIGAALADRGWPREVGRQPPWSRACCGRRTHRSGFELVWVRVDSGASVYWVRVDQKLSSPVL